MMKAQKVNATATATAVGAEGSAPAAPQSPDMVNHPNHYAPNGVDSFMHMKDQMGKDAFDGFLQGNAIKYVQRYKFKGKPTEDLCKAAVYLFHLAFEAAAANEPYELIRRRLAETLDHATEHYGV